MFKPKYTMNGLEIDDKMQSNGSIHSRALRVVLPSHLEYLSCPLYKILAITFDKEFEKSLNTMQRNQDAAGWVGVPSFTMTKTVFTAANAFIFFGPILSANPVFLEAALAYPEHLFLASEILSFVPSFLYPLVAPILMHNHRASNILVEHLSPVIEDRLRQAKNENNQPKPRDCIQFFIDSSTRSRDETWTTKKIVQVLLGTWFAAVHQPALTAVYALENLCRHPSLIDPLREEISSLLPDTNNTKPLSTAIESAPLLDAFLKESSRLHPSDSISVRRKVLTPYTFKDGTHILPGDVACVPLQAIMLDGTHYPSSTTFDPYRFLLPDQSKSATKVTDVVKPTSRFTDSTPTYPLWGLGKHSW